jgi:transcription elongation factor Elf1
MQKDRKEYFRKYRQRFYVKKKAAIATAKWCKEHREKINQNKREWASIIRRLINSIKEGFSCADCEQYYPSQCMDFDHCIGKRKMWLGQRGSGLTIGMVMKEVAKCEIVCSNCHRIRTLLKQNK